MPTVTRRTGSKRAAKPSVASVTNWFRQFLTVNDQQKQEAERAADLKERIKDAVALLGDTDEKENVWLDLPEDVEFKDHKGKVFVYTTLKRERRLTPAQPTPDVDKAEQLLRDKKLWLTKEQERQIQLLSDNHKYVVITVDVDVDAVAEMYFRNQISEEEYDAILVEQKETFAFIPSES